MNSTCRHCKRAIQRHVIGDATIWKHETGLMLCQPDENAPGFTGVEVAKPEFIECRTEQIGYRAHVAVCPECEWRSEPQEFAGVAHLRYYDHFEEKHEGDFPDDGIVRTKVTS